MRIATKLTLTLTAAGFLLFGIYGIHLLQVEERDLRSAVMREMQLLGRSLQVSIENALRDRQLEDIQETMIELERIDPTVHILVYDSTGTPIITPHHVEAPEDDARYRTIEISEASSPLTLHLHFLPPDDPTHIIAEMPLFIENRDFIGELLVVRPLTDMRRDLQVTRRGIAVSVAIFMLVTTLLGLILGKFYITRPLEQLTNAMQRVRKGHLQTSQVSDNDSHEIRELTVEFNDMVEALQLARASLEEASEARRRLQRGLQNADKLISIGQISAGLAHEIGSPLQILNGRARVLISKADNADEVRRNAEIMINQSERITRIVEQLLQYGRRRAAQITEVDLVPAVRAVMDLLDIEANRRRVRLSFEYEPDLPVIRADADQVQQIVLNLVTNALASTPTNGYVIVRLEHSTIARGEALDDSTAVRLSVEDNGTGIPDAIHEKLFDPFFTTREAEGGVGLGLAIVNSIVSEHRGRVWMTSMEGHGSTFFVDLPTSLPQTANMCSEFDSDHYTGPHHESP